ncbi:MAG: hypothetical protein R3248_05150 [Candidatus Promineifilaceae bacterium]|nr:hypothetical protein [Candidatus Promineifilaceae bacterium]
MKTVFGLFENYGDAAESVDALLEEGFASESLNVIVRENVAKENADLGAREAGVQETEDDDGQMSRGLAQILGGEQPVHVSGVRDILAGGELATILAKDAASSFAPGMALEKALRDFGVPQEVAEAYQNGVENGGLILWVRAPDGRAPVVAKVMETENGKLVGDYT